MSRSSINHIKDSKTRYHKNRAKIPFEEKIKIIVELQKIDAEMRKKNRNGLKPKYYKVWEIE